MPFSNGVFQRVYNWVSDKNSAINITASRMDTEDTGFATGLSTCLLKDGTQTVTANIPMSGFKFTGLGAGTANTDSATVGQLQNNTVTWVVSGGTADAITATYSPAITALVDGMELDFRATAANATTTPTFSPSGLTARTITQNGGSALVAGNISAPLFEGKLRYNLANTRWELMNPAVTTQAPFVDSTPIVKGSGDATKLLRFEVDGFTTGTTRVATFPDKNGTVAMTSDLANSPLTSQVFASGTAATYTTPANCIAIKVRCMGPGGGGAGSGSGATGGNGANGSGATTFSGGTLSAGAGNGASGGSGGSGGTTSGGSVGFTGANGSPANTVQVSAIGGNGAGTPLCGGGAGGTVGVAGANAVFATGAAGGGAGISGAAGAGAGGGAGGYLEKIISSPAATYTYTVGTGGAGGTAGTSGFVGGNGGAGVIIVEEFY